MTREFERLRELYWPGRLLDWTVEHRSLPQDLPRDILDGDPTLEAVSPLYGYCDQEGKRLFINLDERAHRSARQRRATLLHEMCHAVRPNGKHDRGFFREIERLLRLGEHALTVRETRTYGPTVLRPFPRCYRRWEKAVEWEFRREL